MKLIVGITGATGTIIGIRLLEALKDCGIETHLVVSEWAKTTLRVETDYELNDIISLASHVYAPTNQAASISSGSFQTDGMIIAPCSMKTLAAIRIGYADNLISRAADVTLKERKKLVVLPREMPLSDIHLDNMLAVSRAGAVIFPPMLTFYNRPSTLDDMINHVVARTLDQFSIESNLTKRWATPGINEQSR